MKKKFREMHEQAQQEQMKQQGFHTHTGGPQPSSKSPSGDYIDFEEVK
jgi:hypothetical protein